MKSAEPETDARVLPHSFGRLRNGARGTVLLIGAGVSADLVPSPPELLRIGKAALRRLDSPTHGEVPEGEDLYEWAEKVLLGLPENPPKKLVLARILGLTSEARWAGKVSISLRGTSPRHRVIARFAREQRWSAIWSYNWDCVLESAFDQVGFRRERPATQRQPWPTSYEATVLDSEVRDDATLAVPIFKPHGCVRKLIDAEKALSDGRIPEAKRFSDRLKVSRTELNQLGNERIDTVFSEKLSVQLRECPLLIVGWKASEPYLKNEILGPALDEDPTSDRLEELTIVDVCLQPGHRRLGQAYALDPEHFYFEVLPKSPGFTTDTLFLWVQALHALEQLRLHAPAESRTHVEQLIKSLERAPHHPCLWRWVDDFLPAWTRLCWRVGVVDCVGFKPHELRLELQDEYVPCGLPEGLPRRDLAAAAWLLSQLPADLGEEHCRWNFTLFPGGFWSECRLVVPLPAWGAPNVLAGIRPLIKSLERRKGLIARLEILPVGLEPNRPPEQDTVEFLRQTLMRDLRTLRFKSIGVCESLRG